MALTIRERILREWESRIRAMAAPDYSVSWNKVSRAPLNRLQKLMKYGVSLLDINQVATEVTGATQQDMTVLVEFHVKNTYGENISQRMNEILGDFIKLFKSDMHTTEASTGVTLSMNIRVVSSEFDIEENQDNFVNGFVELVITYRHKYNDATVKV